MTREDSVRLAMSCKIKLDIENKSLLYLAEEIYNYCNKDDSDILSDFDKLNDVDPDASFEMNIQETEGKVQSRESIYPSNYAVLGKDLVLFGSQRVTVNHPGYSIEFPGETVRTIFEISKDEVGYIIMTKKAWETFKNN